MKRRVNIAVALMSRPRLHALKDPELDPVSADSPSEDQEAA